MKLFFRYRGLEQFYDFSEGNYYFAMSFQGGEAGRFYHGLYDRLVLAKYRIR